MYLENKRKYHLLGGLDQAIDLNYQRVKLLALAHII
jgi:hypothetical protein